MSDKEGANEDYFNPEEEVKITSEVECTLPKEKVSSGEEDEECIYKGRIRLFRWRDGEWKERGTGDLKFLRHKTQKKIRFVLRQDKTLKTVANFMIANDPLCVLKNHQGSDKMFNFIAYDCSEDEPLMEKFVVKIGNAEKAKIFKENWDAAKLFNKLVKEGKESELVYAPVVKDDDKENEKNEEKK